MTTRVRPWLPAAALILVATLLGAPAGYAIVLEPDHLKCYPMTDSGMATTQTADLNNQFGFEIVTFTTKASLFCVETVKNSTNDPRGGQAGHFLCYKITAFTPPAPTTPIFVDDQFGQRQVTLVKPLYLCTPTTKLSHFPG